MESVIPTIGRDPRLAASVGLLAGAGAIDAAAGSPRGALAGALAVVGIYGLAVHARSVGRRRLALHALGLWLAFLAFVPAWIVGIGTVAATTPAPAAAETALTGLTWGVLLAAVGTTTFLGVRGYWGRGARASGDRVLERDSDYRSR